MTADLLRARYETLLEISDSIASHQNLADLLRALRPSLARLIPFDGLGLMLFDPQRRVTKVYRLETSIREDLPEDLEFPADETPTALVLETGRPFYAADLSRESRFPTVAAMLLQSGVYSYCVLPLFTERRRLGSLAFGSVQKNAYSDDEIAFMSQAARQVAVAVENALNYEAAARLREDLTLERDRLRLLLEVNNAVVAQLGLESLFPAIFSTLRRTLQVEMASLTLWDSDARQLRRYALDLEGDNHGEGQDPLIPLDGTPAGAAFRQRKPVVMTRDDLERAAYPFLTALLEQGYRCTCSIPLISGDRVLGTLNVATHRERMAESEVALLEQVARQIAIALDNAEAYHKIEEFNARLAEEKLYLKDEIRSNYFFEEMVGRSAAISTVLRQVETVAPSDSTVLIRGETGTGKELIARAIHNRSARSRNAFVKVNCAAIPMGLLESEMFGHEKGAFTGAIAQRIGRFELAHRGTIFLDEIGDIPLELQPKLLHVLQEHEFERLGSGKTLRVDVRLVAATNADLSRMVEEKTFRADLYYRLNVFPITVPPLRERREDIPLLVSYFAQQFAARMGKKIRTIPSEAMEQLMRYPWPGNIRELQNLVERAVILSNDSTLKIPLQVLATNRESAESVGTLEDAERSHILRALEESNWVISGPHGAAAKLGLKRSTLQFRMKKLGIVRPA
ncbi:MAG: sigma 54-interacting transcriptional regulator [Bryobacterales bacterium]|nr:sigma 54-interacting transcriptional regulator [Bryobacterales bacterium]